MDVKAKGRGSRNESKERFENQIVAPSFYNLVIIIE